jgi:DNA-binding NarL/FixJ family response regulator
MTRVAIVEDDPVTRRSFAGYLRGVAGCKCVCLCATGHEALREIPKQQADVVLMDAQLPDLSGIECTAKLKQLMPSLQIIIVTTCEDTDRIIKALRAGAGGYLLKPCTAEDLVSAIGEARQGGAPMSREIARKVVASFQEPAGSTREVQKLSPRELELLELLAAGFSNKRIAARVGVSDGTVRWHLRHVYHKLRVRSRTEAALKYLSTKKD